MGIGGTGHGPVTENGNCAVCSQQTSARCWQPFPRSSEVSNIPSIVARLNASNCNDDLRLINQGSPLSAYGCSFCPDNHSLIVCTSVIKRQVIQQDALQQHAISNALPTAGFVTLWLIKKGYREAEDGGGYVFESCSHSVFTYSPQPCCKFSPDGQIITAILNSGRNSLTLMRRECTDGDVIDDEDQPNAEEEYENAESDHADINGCNNHETIALESDSSNEEDGEIWFSEFAYTPRGQWGTTFCGRVLCTVFSKCGTKLVSVSKVSLSSYRDRAVHEICMWDILKNDKIKCIWGVSCQIVCPSFADAVTNCKFSPNSEVIGISSNHGHCIFIDSESGQCCMSIDQNNSMNVLNSPCDFDFDPTQSNMVAVVWRYGPLKLFSLSKSEAICTFAYDLEEENLLSSCTSFSPDGSMLAVGTIDGRILILDPFTGKLCKCLDASAEIPDILSQAVFDVAFAKSCQELVAAYSDGQIRIWQLQRILNLQHICRLTILCRTPMNKIKKLLLPKNLVSFLFYDQM